MYLVQMTDHQLVERINDLGEDILATSEHDFYFDNICAQYDAVVEVLKDRGRWE
tara:strand:- start:26944 stop:27105 length:162 start_codon:yes stop_codon:yes gene_type:complete